MAGVLGSSENRGGGATTSLARVRDRIKLIGDRLDGVAVEHLDWKRCVELYDSPDTFFFCDPPYIGTVQHAYKSWTAQEFAGLVARLRTVKGCWMLTINDCRDARATVKGFRVLPVRRARALNCKSGGTELSELIVTPK